MAYSFRRLKMVGCILQWPQPFPSSRYGLEDRKLRGIRPDCVESAIGLTIEGLRKRAGLTQMQLAAAAGINSRTTIVNVELGTNGITIRNLFLLAPPLNSTPWDILRLSAELLESN